MFQELLEKEMVGTGTHSCVASFGLPTSFLYGCSPTSGCTVLIQARVLLDGRLADVQPSNVVPAPDHSLFRCLAGVLHAVQGPPQTTSWVQAFRIRMYLPAPPDEARAEERP